MSLTMPAAAAAAFGADPGRWPLLAADDPEGWWLSAVAAGGQGRYRSARGFLTHLLRGDPGDRLASLALSTRASFLRQLGWHRRAHDWDGRAWARARGDVEAGVDALIGLAADALGVGRLSASAVLLERAADLLGRHGGAPLRLSVRMAWVRAELAMAAGDGTAATAHARRGVELTESALPALRRHRIKSDVILAAALCSAGDLPHSRALADTTLEAAEGYGLMPLKWALCCLLADIGSNTLSPAAIRGERDRSAALVVRHGGRWNIG